MNETLPGLRQAVLNNGYDESIANYVIATIEPFVGYGLTPFNNIVAGGRHGEKKKAKTNRTIQSKF